MVHRRALIVAIMVVACVLLCGLSAVGMWYARGQEFVLPDAQDVYIQGSMPTRMTITYMLPHGQTVRDIQSRLEQHGWQRIWLQAADSGVQPLIFVRHGAFGTLSEVTHIYPSAQWGVEIRVGRCVKIGSYLRCP